MGKPRGAAKTGGRKRGTPNKVTSTIREWVEEVVNGQREQFDDDLRRLPPKERVMVVVKLIGMVLPKPIEKPDPRVLLPFKIDGIDFDLPPEMIEEDDGEEEEEWY